MKKVSNTIDPSNFLSSVQNQTATQSSGSNTLGKDDFLKLLMTELENQDPTNPMSDTDYISQMANFSSLEQMTNMSTSLNNFIQNQEQNQFLQASMLIGKTVTYTNDQNQDTTGVIKSVTLNNGQTSFQLSDDANTNITSSQITGISS